MLAPVPLRCAVLDDYQHAALGAGNWAALAGRVEVQVFHLHLAGDDEVVRALADFEILVLMRERTPLPERVIRRLPKLKLVVSTGARSMTIDLDAAAAAGITVCATRGNHSQTLEFTWALLLALARNVVDESTALRAGGPWQSRMIGADLAGRRLGLLGLGKIGSKMAGIGRAFGMQVGAWSQNLTPQAAAACGAELAPSLDALLEMSDFVCIHLVLSERTRGRIGAAQLRRMKPTAYLINTARAAIVDRQALIAALRGGWIAGAAVDVFEVEPLPPDDEFRSLPNLLATPHLGHLTRGTYGIYYEDAVEDIAAYLAGSPIRVLAAPAPRP